MAGGVAYKNVRQRSDLHGRAVVARRFHPAVLSILTKIGVIGVGFAFPGLLCALSHIPRVRDVLCDGGANSLVVPILNRPHGTKISVHDDAARKIELRSLRVHGKVGYCEVACYAASITKPFRIGGTEQAGVHEISLLYEGDQVLEQI